MKWLVLIHIISAILGLGPAFAFPFMLKRASSLEDMKRMLQTVTSLEMFPKIFGSLAILSGLLLMWLGSYGSWLQLWITGTLIVYAITEVLVVGFMNPAAKRLQQALESSGSDKGSKPNEQTIAMFGRVRNLHAWAGVLGLMIFVLMILKPH